MRNNAPETATDDLIEGLKLWRLWSAFAWEDIRATYRRSAIGVLWISISFLVFVAIKIVIFGPMTGMGNDPYYAQYLLLGLFTWQFINQIVTTAPSVFLASENWIRNDPLPLSVFVYQSIARSLFDLGLTFGVVVLGFLYFRPSLPLEALLFIPAMALVLLNAFWVKMFLGVICTRYRDLGHLIQTVMRVMFFLTPIFWLPSQLGENVMKWLWWNPIAHFLWITRSPVIDGDPVIDSWIFVGVVTVIGCSAALTVFAVFRRRLVFWL